MLTKHVLYQLSYSSVNGTIIAKNFAFVKGVLKKSRKKTDKSEKRKILSAYFFLWREKIKKKRGKEQMKKAEEKRILCLRGEKDGLFDEVFFVLREGDFPKRECDMLREANRILEESMRHGVKRTERKRRAFSILSFLAGAATAALPLLLIFLF